MPSLYPEWNRLQEILANIQTAGLQSLSSRKIFEFGRLYRRACGELAYQRTHEADQPRLAFLNDLVGQCYAYVYVAPVRPWPNMGRFFTVDFPCAVRRHALMILFATLISLIPAMIGYFITWNNPAVANQVLPADLMTHMGDIVARHHTPQDWRMPLLKRAPSACFIMTNDLRIAMLAFAGGMTVGGCHYWPVDFQWADARDHRRGSGDAAGSWSDRAEFLGFVAPQACWNSPRSSSPAERDWSSPMPSSTPATSRGGSLCATPGRKR